VTLFSLPGESKLDLASRDTARTDIEVHEEVAMILSFSPDSGE